MAIAGDVLKVTAQFEMDGQILQNVWHVAITTGADDGDLSQDLAVVMEEVYDGLLAGMSEELQFDAILVKNLTQDGVTDIVNWPTLTVGGAVGQHYLPLGVAGLMTFPTAQPKTRGRKFIPGLHEANLTDGLFDTNQVNALLAAALSALDVYVGTLTGTDIIFGVVDLLDAFHTFTGALVTNNPAYQRRRKIGFGE